MSDKLNAIRNAVADAYEGKSPPTGDGSDGPTEFWSKWIDEISRILALPDNSSEVPNPSA